MNEDGKIKQIMGMLERGAGADIMKTQSEVIFSILDISYHYDISLEEVIADYKETFRRLYGPKQNTQKKTP